MAYTVEIVQALTANLSRFATLNPHQLAGHVANLDFWLSEVRHGTGIIDGYRQRFDAMKRAQAMYVEKHGTVEFSVTDNIGRSTPTPPKPMADSELKSARRELLDAAYRLLVRCYKAELINEARLRAAATDIGTGVEAADLR